MRRALLLGCISLMLTGCAEPPAAAQPLEAEPAAEAAPVPLTLVVRGFVEGDDMVVRVGTVWSDGLARPFEGWIEVFVRPLEEGRDWLPRYWMDYADAANFTDHAPTYFELEGDATWLRDGEHFLLDARAETWDGHSLVAEYTSRA